MTADSQLANNLKENAVNTKPQTGTTPILVAGVKVSCLINLSGGVLFSFSLIS
jgi:hypothetical protein